MHLIPHRIPDPSIVGSTVPAAADTDPSSSYDVAINNLQFVYSSTVADPSIRQTAPFERTRIDQAAEPGEQTLTGWWIKSQSSFHAGAGQLNIEPAQASPTSHLRYDMSKNVDVSVPGRVTRLPDTTLITSDVPLQMVAVNAGGQDALVYIVGTSVKALVYPGPVVTAVTAVTEPALSVTTSGSIAYVTTTGGVWVVDPTALGAANKIASFPSTVARSVCGYAHARLMVAGNNAVYQVDVNTTGVTLGTSQLVYTHPVTGWTWVSIASSAQAILLAGHGGGQSTVTQFSDTSVAGVPTLVPNGEIYQAPGGERILSMQNVQSSFLAVGTTAGLRVGTYDAYYSRLTVGPLTLLATDPVIPGTAMATRARFVYVAGRDYDEAGLMKLDVGVVADAAGRYAWTPDLITPALSTSTSATTVAVLTATGKLVFGVTGQGIYLEGTGAGTGREAWLRTSRIRYSTTEPKLFKLAQVRGSFFTGQVKTTASTPSSSAVVNTSGFTVTDPDPFKLVDGKAEWLQLRFDLTGATTVLYNWNVKALPGTKRMRDHILQLSLYDSETTRTGHRVRDTLAARSRLEALEAMDAAGDIVTLQEFTPLGVISTQGVIQQVKFIQIGRPTARSDVGGNVEVIIRTTA